MLLTFIGHSTGELEILAKEGTYTQRQMAKELGVDQSTISREWKRGKTQQMNSDRTYYNVYLADAGSRVYQENRKNSLAKDHSKYSSTFLKSSLKQLLRRMTSHESIVSTHSFTHIVERILMNVYRVQKLFIR